jgi:alkylation response protein AidB-like acyl-CoA dehydrogenase
VHRRQAHDQGRLRRWQKILHAAKAGARSSWPQKYGGTGWNGVQQHIFDEECADAGAPMQLPFGLKMVAPVIMAFGNPAQQAHFLPRIVDGTDWWCQGYSEPGSGSDLASLKTRAVREGDHYVVNGQKTWNTLGQYADWIFCLVRTSDRGPPAGGHLLPADRHEDAGHHGAPDHHDGRRTRDQRSLVRGRQGARSRTWSARRTRAGPTPSSCSATSAPASPASAAPSAN